MGKYETPLKPCPFCGRKTTVSRTFFGWETITCEQCNVSMGATEHTKPDGYFTEKWNRRASVKDQDNG